MKISDFFINSSELPNVTIYRFFNSLKLYFLGEDRLSIKPLAVYILISALVYLFSKNQKGKKSIVNIFKFVFPKKIYLHPSAKMDFNVFFIRMIFNPAKLVTFSALSSTLAMLVSGYLQNNFAGLGGKIESNSINLFLISLCGFLIFDFSQYFVHRFFHTFSLFWPFHSPHHSAEVLNPFTVQREHFVWEIFDGLLFNFFIGLGQGVFMWAGDPYVNPHQIFKFSLVFNFFNYLVGNLHHSHIWISFGFLDRVFLSPALHQIHHSVDLKHRNKNYGYFLSIWDQMFGTLYIPKEKENLVFGIERGVKNPHETILKFYFLPFKESALVFKKKFPSFWNIPILKTKKLPAQNKT